MRAVAVTLALALGAGRAASQTVDVWSVTPAAPTVGDTVIVSRHVVTPPGWRVRAGKFEPTDAVDALAEPVVAPRSGGWDVSYFLVAWVPGEHTIGLPPVWRLGPDGATDSLPGADASVHIRSVLPDDPHTGPQPALAPIERPLRRPWAPGIAGLLALALGGAGVAWRRRPARRSQGHATRSGDKPVPDAKWLTAGEPKAVAARASGELRVALAHAHPRAVLALSTVECLMALEGKLPRATLGELTDVLAQLDRVAFASAHGSDVAVLADRARALARALS